MSGWDDRPAEGHVDLATRERYERRFRGHVQTLSNPKGRIVRLPCAFFVDCGSYVAEAHHIKYEPDWTFIVVWTCASCHRKVEYGSLRVGKRQICDYTSLVRNILRPGLYRENRREPDVSFEFGANAEQEKTG